MIDELWALLGQLRECRRSLRLKNPALYMILCALGYAAFDERLYTVSITQTGRDALAEREKVAEHE